MLGIAAHHVEIVVLAAIVEADPQPEAVRQRDLLLDRLGGVDGGRALVVDHLARHQMPAVRGGIEQHVGRAVLRCRLRARPSATCRTCRRASKERSSQNRMKRCSGAARRCASRRGREAISSRWISTSFSAARPRRCTALTSELLPMPRAPQSSALLAGSPRAKRVGIGEQRIAHAVDALEQRKRHAVDRLRRGGRSRVSACQTKASRRREVGRFGLARSEPLERAGDPLDEAGDRFLKVHVAPVAKAFVVAIVAPPSRDKARRERQRAVTGRGRPSLSQAKDRSNDRIRLRSSRPGYVRHAE